MVVACAATLHHTGTSINDAADAATALRPLAGRLAADLFAFGLIGGDIPTAIQAGGIVLAILGIAVVTLAEYMSGWNLQIDEALMDELKNVRDAVKPMNVLLVVDAMTGQEAVNVAQAADGTQQVSASIEGVSEAARQSSAASGDLLQASAELSRQGEELRSTIDRFVSR